MNWTDYFYNIAQQVKEKSKDERTKVGAVIVGKDKEIVSTGYNSFPRGIIDLVGKYRYLCGDFKNTRQLYSSNK